MSKPYKIRKPDLYYVIDPIEPETIPLPPMEKGIFDELQRFRDLAKFTIGSILSRPPEYEEEIIKELEEKRARRLENQSNELQHESKKRRLIGLLAVFRRH